MISVVAHVEARRRDGASIAEKLGVAQSASLRSYTLSGDRHLGGETLMLAFDAGERLVFKLRPSAAERLALSVVRLFADSDVIRSAFR